MPRPPRSHLAAPFFHVVNRGIRRSPIFTRPVDYRAFLGVLKEGLQKHDVTLESNCLMSNHWHLVVEPAGTAALARFMQWVTATHAIRWHHHRHTVGQGALYQGRYFASPLSSMTEVVYACRYVERNALRAGLVRRAQDWPWCSLAERLSAANGPPLKTARFLTSQAWIDYVNQQSTARERIEEPDDFARSGDRKVAIRPLTSAAPSTSGTKRPKSVENTSVPL